MTNFLFSTTKAALLTLVLIGAMQLTGFAQVGVTITPVGPLCAGNNLSITTTVSGGIAPYSYSWAGPNGFLSSDANPTRTSVGTALSGSFSVTVTSSDGLTGTASTNITVNDVLASISVTPSSSVCSYQTLTINAAGGGTYLWNTGATSASINPTTTGLYAVTVSRNGCSARVCQNITVTNVVAIINASASTITCTTPSTTLTASGGNTYQWSNGLGTNSVVTASPSVNTTYTVTATGPNGCTSTASVAIVVDNANPIASINPSAATINCTTTSTTLTASGGGTYAWNNGLGSSATVSITPTVSTNYIVTVTATNGCTATASSSITVNQTPPFAGISPASGTLTCNTTSITFTATSVAGATYLWQDGTTNNTFVASSAGTVSVTMRDPSNGCTATASASVNANNTPPSPALTGPTNSCVGSNASFTLGTSFSSYAWSVTGGTIAGGGTSTSNAVSVSWATAGTGRVEVTVTGSNGCTASTSYNVTVVNSISLSNITTACNILGTNYTLGFDIAGGLAPYTVTGVGGSIASNTFTSVTISQGTPVTVTVSSGSGCQAVTLTRTQTCTPPTACVPNTGCLGTNLVVDGNFESFNVSQGASSPFNNFTSNFAYQSLATLNSSPCSISSTPILCAYRFGVATSPTPYNPTWSSNVRDHTTGAGNMMILDFPAGNVSPNNNIWCQTVTLAPASTFCFGTYAINLLPTGSNQPLPVFRFTANGNTLGLSQPVPESEQWGFYGYTFNSGAGGPTQLCIANNNFGAVGYDLAIDDISIRQQLPGTPPTAIDDLALLCANSNATVGNVLTNDQPNGSSITSVRVIVAPAFTDGRVTLTNNGDFTFVRDASFTTGSTTFDYEICHTSGCCDIGRVTITNANNPTITVSPSSFVLNCTTTSVTATANGGASYLWDGGQTTNTLAINAPGTYTVIGTNASGCTASASVSVTQDIVAPTVTITPSSFVLNCTTTAVTATANGANSYVWGAGQTTGSININSPNTYTVTGTNTANGCTASANTVVTQDIAAPTVTLSPSSFELNCTATVATINASGADTYSWTGGQTTAATTFNSAGVYTVVGTSNSNGCTASANVSITQNVTAPTVTVSPTNFVLNCSTTSTTVTASGADSYLWSSGEITPSVVYSTAGVFTVTGTSASNGCTSSAAVTITQDNAAPSAFVNASSALLTCSNTSITITAGSLVANPSYDWGGGNINPVLVVNAPGNYIVTVTDNSNGCTSTASRLVNQNVNAPTVTLAPNSFELNCTTTSVTITASGANTYAWSTGETTASVVYNAPGVYIVTGTNTTNGCTASANTTVTQNVTAPALTVAPTSFELNCTATSVTVTASGASTYAWSTGETTTSAVYNTPGVYTVSGTDNANGCTASANVTVTQNITAPALVIAPTTFELNCTATAVTVTASGASTYAWSSGETTATVVYNTPGVYTVTGTNTANGCTASANVTVTQDITAPTVTVAPNSFVLNCTATAVTVTASGANTYAWSTGETTASVVYNTASVYTVSGTDTSNGCVATASVTVTQNITTPALVVTPSTFQLNCTATSVTVTASGASIYVWSTGETTASVVYNTPGVYSVTGTDNANGCTSSNNVTVTQDITVPTVVVAPTTFVLDCTNTAVSATASGAVSYLWDGGQTSATLAINAAGVYGVTGTSANGCTASANISVTQNATPPSATINATSGLLTCANTSITLTAGSFVANPSYNWGAGNTSTTLVVNAPGNYIVTITDNDNGCTATASRNITQDITAPTVTVAPNSFVLNCTATAVTVTASGGNTYAWSTGETTASVVYNTPGVRTVIGTNNTNGCTASANVTVTQNITAPALVVTPSTFQLNCTATSVTVTASGASTYAWSTGETTASVGYNAPGVYSVTGTNNANGCTASANVTVTQNITAPTVVVVPNSFVLNCAATAVTVTASGANTYTWSTGQTTASVVYNTPGIRTVIGTNNTNGCTASANVTITQDITAPALVVAPSTFQLNCTATAVTVTASGASTYAWSTGETSTSVVYNTPGVRTVVGTNNTNGCTASANVTVTQDITTPSVVLSPSTFVLNCTTTNTNIVVSGASNYVWSNGGVSATINVSAAGIYTVTGTNTANGCTATASATVTLDNTPPVANITPSAATLDCTNPTTTLTATGGGAYLWPDGSNSNTFTVNAANQYTVTVTAANGCTATATSNVGANFTPPTPSVTQSNPAFTCLVTNITLTANGGGTYLWSDASNGNTIVAPAPGLYSLTVTAANGCTASTSVNIGGSTLQVTATVAVTNVQCTGQCNGRLTISPANGTAPYTFLWSNGQTTQTATGLCVGNFNYTITDANGCRFIGAASVGQPSSPLSVNANTNTIGTCGPVCNGAALSVATGGTLPYTFLWSDGQTVSNATGLCAGNAFVTVTDANGCTALGSTSVPFRQTNQPTISFNSPLCEGQRAEFRTQIYNGQTVVYDWAFNGSPVGSNSNTFAVSSADLDSAGIYSVTVTVNGCPSVPTSVTLVVAELPTVVTLTGGGLFCEGVSATLTAVTGSMAVTTTLTYDWTGPNGFTRSIQSDGSLVFPALTVAQSGRYTVRTRTPQGCLSNTYSVDIQVQPVPAAPELTLSDAFLCEGEQLVLSTPSVQFVQGGYFWFHNGVALPASLVPNTVVGPVTLADAGRYQLQVNVNGCFSPLSGNRFVTVSSAPAVTPTVSSPVCVGAPVTFSAGFSAGLTYAWSGPLGFSGNTASPGIASATVAQSGTYYLVATDRTTGCATTASVTLQVNATPATPAAANSGPACAGSAVSLTLAQGGTFGATYTWVDATTGATIGTSTAANGLLSTSLPAGTYNFAVYASFGGCSGGTSQPTTVTVRPAGTATAFAGPDFGLCGNTSTILTAFAPQGVSGIWSTTGTATIASPTSPNSPVTGLVVGVNRFTWTLTGCDSGSDVLEIIVSDPVLDRAFAGSDQSLCGGVTTANLAARATSAGVPGRWEQVSGPLANIASQNTPSTAVTGLQPGRNVFVWSVNGGACGQDSRDSVVLEVVIPLVLSATNDSYTMAPSTPSLNGQSVAGNDAFPNNAVFTLISGTSQGTLEFRGDGSFDYARSSATIDYTETFTYRVCASDACGTYCATATVVVSVEGTNPLANQTDCPFIPNIITPNGDNVNDALVVRCAGDLFSNGVEINIFNRYGDEVFSSKDYHSDWQGTFNGEPLPTGTYYYIVKTPRSTETVRGFFVIQR